MVTFNIAPGKRVVPKLMANPINFMAVSIWGKGGGACRDDRIDSDSLELSKSVSKRSFNVLGYMKN